MATGRLAASTVVLVLLAGLACAVPAAAETVTVDMAAQETVFDPAVHAQLCPETHRTSHGPDLPARAFRDDQGRTQLLISNEMNIRMVSTSSLNELDYDCSTVAIFPRPLPGSVVYDHDREELHPPEYFDHNEWLSSPYTLDGRTVYSLVHNEFHGYAYKGATPNPHCSSSDPAQWGDCWQSSITSAISTDSGDTYTHPQPAPANAGHLVASLPYRIQRDWGSHGYAGASNIVRNPADGYYYVMSSARGNGTGPLFTETGTQDQQAGPCLFRSPTIPSQLTFPGPWKMWRGEDVGQPGLDEADFVSPIDPYRSSAGPARHRCQPVEREHLPNARSLTYNTALGKFMLAGSSQVNGVSGLYYSLSDDLVHWSKQKLLMPDQFDPGCPTKTVAVYPSVLDPADPAGTATGVTDTRNFNRPGATPWLYFTRRQCDPRKATLVRAPMTIDAGAPSPPSRHSWGAGLRVNMEPFGSRFKRLRADGASAWDQLPASYGCQVAHPSERVGCVDAGSPFSDSRGYGWVQDSAGVPASAHRALNLTSNAVDRGHPASQYDRRLDTFVYMQYAGTDAARVATPASWEASVPNGIYRVTTSVGDPDYASDGSSTHWINAEGVNIVKGFRPSKGAPWRAATKCVTVTDGRLTLDARGGTNTKLNYVEISAPLTRC